MNFCWQKPRCVRLLSSFVQVRKTSTKVRLTVALDENIYDDVKNNVLKPRKHPGIIKLPPAVLPSDILEGLKGTADSFYVPIKQLLHDGVSLRNYIVSRHPPHEDEVIEEKKVMLQEKIENKISFDKSLANEEERKHYEKIVSYQLNWLMAKHMYYWKPINFDLHTGLKYAFIRGPAEYAILCRVFAEIKKNCSDYPQTVFDFGSGVGTVRWAAESTWGNSIKEFYCVDASSDMNVIASRILEKSGRTTSKSFMRQFLPASHQNTYDIVISSFSLFELPSASARLQTIASLWNKTSKYLVLVETGSLASFLILKEARDFILERYKHDKSFCGHVVAPCPHDLGCPRDDGTPCNFEITYQAYHDKQPKSRELFSYIILEKGKQNETDVRWPRIVRPVLRRSGHVVCKLCTNRGKLEQVTISRAKPNRESYRCAKASSWGDLLPVEVVEQTVDVAEDDDDGGSE